ncbi:hypothetical protein NIES267_37750 [Calothrix parasitica NIES-267]|uniref:Uncharacterized protein n=1 Tax=Calothrix parasitica NIES-267 TaxID=1973488 RepID=A0A1Z4LSR0_9CYAN|nr:hypothetical protein NIES267_37750 [Calothrix parasitica NIES-267]
MKKHLAQEYTVLFRTRLRLRFAIVYCERDHCPIHKYNNPENRIGIFAHTKRNLKSRFPVKLDYFVRSLDVTRMRFVSSYRK